MKIKLLNNCNLQMVCECAVQLLYACKEAGGNVRATLCHDEVDESANTMRENLADLLATAETVATQVSNSVNCNDEKNSCGLFHPIFVSHFSF